MEMIAKKKGRRGNNDSGTSRRKSEFALYEGDRLLGIGTKYELAERYGLTPQYVYWASTPSAKAKFYKHGGTGYTSVNLSELDKEGNE